MDSGLTDDKYKYNIHERFPWDPVMLGQRVCNLAY